MSCSADTSGCAYTYQAQPLKTLECNPYQERELRLYCEIRGPDKLAFNILWYWKQRNNQPPQRLSGPENNPSTKYNLRSRFSSASNFQVHGSQLRIQQLNDRDAGLYYCQGNLSNGTLLAPSNMLNLTIHSEYTSAPNCSDDEVHTTRKASCATDDSATVGTTPPNLATGDSRGPTDPPSNSPTMDGQQPSLPTTLAPTPTATPTPESGMLQVALYAVISVIVVFCAVIVTLAVTIVILYRRKGGHANFKKTAG